MNIAGNILLLSHFRRQLKQLYALYLTLVLDIGAKIRLNYFSLINVSDYSVSATIICYLHAALTLQTTAVTTSSLLPSLTIISLPPPGTVRVSIH
ncbi:conserved hypothetical protein [Coccidioides posadasii str. Silveira]|uniref:Uncharacterized protein n=1 Tax=Coccidioides posadasii (strain RMSCC 757 / Silveira) TaxID=443226 RepID=E9DGZ0_COCPS|nr:conserved hypothetical protein [Coccidioides posadasii str. Silveira]